LDDVFRRVTTCFDVLARIFQSALKEKLSQIAADTPAIPRLGIPAYSHRNECLHPKKHRPPRRRRSPASLFPPRHLRATSAQPPPQSQPQPRLTLCGFTRVTVPSGAQKQVTIEPSARQRQKPARDTGNTENFFPQKGGVFPHPRF